MGFIGPINRQERIRVGVFRPCPGHRDDPGKQVMESHRQGGLTDTPFQSSLCAAFLPLARLIRSRYWLVASLVSIHYCGKDGSCLSSLSFRRPGIYSIPWSCAPPPWCSIFSPSPITHKPEIGLRQRIDSHSSLFSLEVYTWLSYVHY